jgi:hypothetical protein
MWQGRIYIFPHGKSPDFQSAQLNFAMARNLIELNEAIMKADLISQLPPMRLNDGRVPERE